jgi:hypothetical protein
VALLVVDGDTPSAVFERSISPEGRDEKSVVDLTTNVERRSTGEGKDEDGLARLCNCLERSAAFSLLQRYSVSLNEDGERALARESQPMCRAGRYCSTSSARARRDGGSVSPRVSAVVRLITNSNVVGCSMGRSPGLAPLRIWST